MTTPGHAANKPADDAYKESKLFAAAGAITKFIELKNKKESIRIDASHQSSYQMACKQANPFSGAYATTEGE